MNYCYRNSAICFELKFNSVLPDKYSLNIDTDNIATVNIGDHG